MGTNETLKFDITANDRGSEAFSRFGRSVADVSSRMDGATARAVYLDDTLKRQAETARRSTDATLALAKSDEILGEVERRLADGALEAEFALKKEAEALKEVKREADRLDGKHVRVKVDVDRSGWSRIGALFGGGGGVGSGGGGLFGSVAGLVPGAVPGGAYGAIAGILAAPFAAQLAAGGLVGLLGGGLAGLGVAGSLLTPKAGAAPSPQALRAAADQLAASQDRLNALRGKGATSAAQLAGAEASVASAQDRLNRLQASAAANKDLETTYKTQLKVQAAFGKLGDDARESLARIGTSFAPVMLSIFTTADTTMKKLTPVFAGAVKAISGPFQVFADTLIRSFDQPAVKASIDAVAKSFGLLLKALTPQLGGDVAQVADGISRIARSVSDHPQAFADFVKGFFKIAGIALDGISALANFEGYLQQHFWPAVHRTAVIFDGARHDIAHVWDQIFENSVGVMIRLGHNIETQFSSMRHGTAVVFDGIRGDIAHYWDMTWNNTIGREQRGVNDVVHWLGTLPGKIGDVFKGAGTWLVSAGRSVISGLWSGLKSTWSGVLNWAGGLWHGFLSALGPFHSPPKWASWAGEQIMHGLFGWLSPAGKSKLFGQVSSIGGQFAATAAGAMGAGSTGAEQRYAASLLGGWGWGHGQLGPLIALWNRESGWNPFAVNPSSGAYGIPQALGHGHPFSLGDWASQIRWGLAYIFGRYGSPAAAWAHEMSVGWYDRGGYLPPGLSLAYNGTGRPEPVGPMAAVGAGSPMTVIVQVDPVIAAVTPDRTLGRHIADHLGAHIKGGGRLYPAGVTPR